MSFTEAVAGFTFRVRWDEHEQDYIGTIDELPGVRCFYGNRDAAFMAVTRHAIDALERDADASNGVQRVEELRQFLTRLADRASN